MKSTVSIFVLLTLLLPSVAFGFSDKLAPKQVYLQAIDYTARTKEKSTGAGVVVAVIDQGIWQEHPELAHSTYVNQDEIPQNNLDDDNNGYVDDYYGWNFLYNNSDMRPQGSHGTQIGGIIAAAHNGQGIAGIAPGVKLMSLIACSSETCSTQAVFNAITYAVDNGADIINLSLGRNGYLGYATEYDKYIKYAYDKGVIVVVSAGNGDPSGDGKVGQNLSFIKASPVSNDVNGDNTVIGVGAQKSGLFQPTSWSNYGKGVDAWAPGEEILSTCVPEYCESYLYDYSNGTSFAAPIVVATAALIKSAYPKLKAYEIADIISVEKIRINEIFNSIDSNDICKIPSFQIKVENGSSATVIAEHLRSRLTFRIVDTNEKSKTFNNIFEITDARKLKINTSLASIPEGRYLLEESNNYCKVGYNYIDIVGEKRVTNKVGKITQDAQAVSPPTAKFLTENTKPLISVNDEKKTELSKSAQKIYGVKDIQALEEGKKKIATSILVGEGVDNDSMADKISLTVFDAMSKLRYPNAILQTVLEISSGSPTYRFVISRKVGLFGIEKLAFEQTRVVYVDSTDLTARPKGESKLFDFLFW